MKEKRLVRFQKWMARGSLIAGACFVLFFSFSLMEESIPDKIWIEKGEEENFDFHLPVIGEMSRGAWRYLATSPLPWKRTKLSWI